MGGISGRLREVGKCSVAKVAYSPRADLSGAGSTVSGSIHPTLQRKAALNRVTVLPQYHQAGRVPFGGYALYGHLS